MEQIVYFSFQVPKPYIAGVIFLTTFGKYWRMNVHVCNNRFRNKTVLHKAWKCQEHWGNIELQQTVCILKLRDL